MRSGTAAFFCSLDDVSGSNKVEGVVDYFEFYSRYIAMASKGLMFLWSRVVYLSLKILGSMTTGFIG